MSMLHTNGSKANKYRAALEVLQRGRELLVEDLADEVLDQSDDLIQSGYAFNEFLENQGTRVHFLCLLMAQLEQSADALDETEAPVAVEIEVEPPPPPSATAKRKRRSRSKKLQEQGSPEGAPDDA
jgi:hypothetical protein